MDDTDPVRRLQRIADLQRNMRGSLQRHGSTGRSDEVGQILALEQLHDDESLAGLQLDEVRDVDDVVVPDLVYCLSLFEEPRHRVPFYRVLGPQQLERDISAKSSVLGVIHLAHPALAERLEDPVGAEHASDVLVGAAHRLADSSTHARPGL